MAEKLSRSHTFGFATFIAIFAFSSTLTSAVLQSAGPNDPSNGFPLWYRDQNGLTLAQCLQLPGTNTPDTKCALPPIETNFDPAQAISFPANFPSEFFYWVADSDPLVIGSAGAGIAKFRMALEAAFATADGSPAAGKQIAFLRINLQQISGLNPNSTYTVTYPFGQFVFHTDASGSSIGEGNAGGGGRAFRNQDGGDSTGAFTDLLPAATTNIGPFLTAVNPAPPAGYIGDEGTLSTITPGPGGAVFRINGTNVGGVGVDTVETNQWTIAGRIFSDTTAPAITVIGPNPVYVLQNSVYSDAGATSSDDIDGNITSSITVVNPVNTAVLGRYFVTYNVTDSFGNSASAARTVNVATNLPPVIEPVDPMVTLPNMSVIFDVNASDADDDALIYSLSGAPIGATINATNGTFSWIQPLPSGNHTFDIIVTDNINTPSSVRASITVNTPPEVSAIPAQTAVIGKPFTFTVQADDVDNDILRYSVSGGSPSGLAINESTGIITWTPSAIGVYTFNARVRDNVYSWVSTLATITVNNNTPPVIDAIAPKTTTPGSALAFDVTATDADNDALAYSLSGNVPTGALISPATGAFSWTPTVAGVYSFNAVVSDGFETDSTAITITVSSPSVASIATSDTIISASDEGSEFVEIVTYSGAMDTTAAPSVLFSPGVSNVLTNCAGSWPSANMYRYACLIANIDAEIESVNVTVSGGMDAYGNAPAGYTLASQIDIDTKPPATWDDHAIDEGLWENNNQTIAISPACGSMGCSWTKYCFGQSCDAVSGNSYTGPISVTDDGVTYIRYASQDNAGNMQPVVTRMVKIDRSSSKKTITPVPNNITSVASDDNSVKLEINSTSGSSAAISIRKTRSHDNSSRIAVPSLNKYVDISAPALTGTINRAMVKVDYTDAEVSAAGIDENSLRLYYYNETSGVWAKYDGSDGNVPDGGVDTANNYVWVLTDHFSVWGMFGDFALAPVPVITTSNGGSNGFAPQVPAKTAKAEATTTTTMAPAAIPEVVDESTAIEIPVEQSVDAVAPQEAAITGAATAQPSVQPLFALLLVGSIVAGAFGLKRLNPLLRLK